MGVMNVRGGRRTVLVVAHTGRKESLRSARLVVSRLIGAGVAVRVLRPEAATIACMGAEEVPPGPEAAEGAEIVIVVGGDGTLLRAAELARPAGAPLLGVNLGHVGFLAEAEPDGLADTVDRVVARHYVVEERMTIGVMVRQDGAAVASTWALNEATVEKTARERMLEVVTEIDGRPLSRWGCDGVVCATPTGSTAYAFSAGGPVVWPEVEALLMVPISAHALFARPMVVSPRSVLAVEIIGGTGRGPEQGGLQGLAEPAGANSPGAVMWCDGRRRVDLEPGARVEVRRGAIPVLLARLHGIGAEDGPQEGVAVGGAPFTDRLVAKFGLPVAGWRGGRLDGRPRLPVTDGEAAWDDLAGDDLAGGPDSREETAGGHA
jgi:NAD+ kinase